MKRIITLLFIAFASLVLGADAVPPNKYSLSVARVHESKPERPEWVFIFFYTSATRGGETVCRSPETLKKLLKGLPRGSTLDWWPTCDGDSEALADHLDDLKMICTEAGIVFTFHPAGHLSLASGEGGCPAQKGSRTMEAEQRMGISFRHFRGQDRFRHSIRDIQDKDSSR